MPWSPPDWLDPHGDATPVIEPGPHIREIAARTGQSPDSACPRLVMGGFIDPMIRPMIEAADANDSGLHPHLKLGGLDNHAVGVARIPIGAPRAVAVLEELVALGARTILIAGAIGSLQPHVEVGHYVIPSEAVREEGTSYHYAPAEQSALAHGPATLALAEAAHNGIGQVHQGCVWTTDAPYREFAGKVQAYASKDVLGVDMETSALMIAAAFRGVDLGLILTVSDLVHRRDWPNIFGTDEYRANCTTMAAIVVQAAKQIIRAYGGDDD